MGIEENKSLVRRFYEEVVSRGEVSRVAEFVASDCVESYAGKRLASGIEGMTRHITGVRDVYPDLQVVVERQIAEGEWVATQIVARGTHRGSWLGMKPTGRQLEFTGVNIDRVDGGRIVEHGGAANMLEPLLEAGALKTVGD